MSDRDSDEDEYLSNTTKKRKQFGRVRDVAKKIRVQSHEPGKDCKCRQKCFERIPLTARSDILKKFNLMESTDEQNAYLSGLISVIPVQTRRPRQDPLNANLKDVPLSLAKAYFYFY